MANRPSRIVVPAFTPSYDGRYHLRYAHGDKPVAGAALDAIAQGQLSATAQLSAAIRLAVFSTILLSSIIFWVAGSELTRFILIMSFKTTAVVARGIFG